MLIVTKLLNIIVNDFGAKKAARLAGWSLQPNFL